MCLHAGVVFTERHRAVKDVSPSIDRRATLFTKAVMLFRTEAIPRRDD